MKSEVKVYLTQLIEQRGSLKASEIVTEARDSTNPLHHEFEWDDAKSAHEYRLWQARKLIKRYNVTVLEPEEKLVHVPKFQFEQSQDENREGEYRPLKTVVSVISDFDRALSEALTALKAAKERVLLLKTVAEKHRGEHKEENGKAALLAIALQGLNTVESAVARLH